MKTRILVWDIPTRLFHWLLAASFAGAFLTAESEYFRDLHVLLGYAMLALIGFRLLWGIVGTRYARFSALALRPARLNGYLKSLLTRTPQHYVGHNPAGSWMIVGLLALGLLTGMTGYATFNEIGGEWLEELHEGAANTMLALVAVHILGVLVSSLLHRENLVRSMITGRKTGPAAEGIASAWRSVAALMLVAVVGFWALQWQQAPAGGDTLAQQGAAQERHARRERGRDRDDD